MLYSPETSYTLVFIGYLDKVSFTTIFANEKYIICNPSSTWVTKIPCNSASLYKLIKKTDNKKQMNSIIKSLILDQIDYCLGYITLAAALKLFNNVIVISL